MSNRTVNLITELNQREKMYGIFNNTILNNLDKDDKRIRKRIGQQFKPITPNSTHSYDEDFDFAIKKLARQILIAEDIEIEVQNFGNTPGKDEKIIIKNLRQICIMLERGA